jgi:hypothetical protein
VLRKERGAGSRTGLGEVLIFAYGDPNAASSIYQLLLPVLIAVGALWSLLVRFVKRLWHSLRQGIRGQK